MQKINTMIGIQRSTTFNGKRKIGLDTNILIKLYDTPDLFDYEESRIFNEKDTIFIHRICFYELVKYLCKKDYSEELAKKEAKEWLNSRNIKGVFTFIPEEEAKKFEDEVNQCFKEKKLDLKCHRPDSFILLSYKKEGINKVISTDESFRESAKFLGIDGEGLPSLNSVISRKLRGFFEYRKHKKKH